jgi:hypothetical protein
MSRHEELGDAFNAGKVAHNASHDYFSFMLLKEKLEAQGVAPGTPLYNRVVGARSEKEALELHILAVIQGPGYGESSANFSQLVDLTGTRDKIQQAKFLAEKVYEREATKMILNRFAPNPSVAAGRDPVSGEAIYGFQALINQPREGGLVTNLAGNAGFGSRSGSVAARALAALTGIPAAAAGAPLLAGGAGFAGV